MWPKDYDGVPTWERDFWDTLMEDQGVKYKTHDACPCGMCTGDTVEGVSPYWTEDVLVGEIVEDEQLELGA